MNEQLPVRTTRSRFAPRAVFAAAAVMATVGALLLAGCGSSGSSSAASGSGGSSGSSGETYSVVLSNNYMGNAWRPQMVNAVEHVAATNYKGKVNFSVVNAENTTAAQIASLQSIIRQKPDAIIMDAASATALNPTIELACKQGIVVVSFDQTATAACGYQLEYGYKQKGHDMAMWLATVLKGKGKIILDEGLAGAAAAEAIDNSVEETLKEFPGISIVGKYQSEYAAGPEVQGVSSLVSQNPDIAGVISLMYCSSVEQAFKQAGKSPVPSTCIGANGNAMICQKLKVPCFMYSAPSLQGALALEEAVQILEGKKVAKVTAEPKLDYTVNSEGVEFESEYPYKPVSNGEGLYPSESPELFVPVTYGSLGLTPADVLK